MENDNKRIKLPVDLALEVIKVLQSEYGREPREDKRGLLDLSFTPEELGLIKTLKIKHPVSGCLKGIHLLPNLEVLEVKSNVESDYTHPKNILSIDDSDVEEIAKCKSLVSLSVVNQNKISWLNVCGLEQLHTLRVTHNNNLELIYGMNQIPDLWSLECYGNRLLYEIENLDQIVLNAEETHLDVLLFPNAIGYNHLTGNYNREALNRIRELGNVGGNSWREGMSGNKFIKINTAQMIQMHNKACEILADNIPEYASNRDIVIAIENYIAKNIIYDYDSTKDNHNHTHSVETLLRTRMQVGPKLGANGAYNAIIENTSVCQGFTRAMQYLLKLKGINSHDVMCIGEKDNGAHTSQNNEISPYDVFRYPEEGFHSIICIDDLDCLYDDPCWNAIYHQHGRSMPFILLDKEEISQTHTLSFNERLFSPKYVKVPRSAIEESIARNKLFIQSRARTGAVQQTRDKMQRKIKGKILEEGKDI